MSELMPPLLAEKLTGNLLVKYNLLIKNLSSKIKTGQYVRLAVRNRKDNDKLLIALRQELEQWNEQE